MMTRIQATKKVKKKYPFAIAIQIIDQDNHFNSGWMIKIATNGRVLVQSQRSEDDAWLAAAEKIENLVRRDY